MGVKKTIMATSKKGLQSILLQINARAAELATMKPMKPEYETFCIYAAEQLLSSLDLTINEANDERTETKREYMDKLHLFETLSARIDDNQEQTNEIVFQRFQDSLFPLFDYCKKELAVFDKRFTKVEHKYHYRFTSSYPTPPENLYEAINLFYDEKILGNIQEFSWIISWKGLRSYPDEKYNIGISMTFRFEEFLYKVTFLDPRDPLLAKTYSSKVLPADMFRVAGPISQFIAERIVTNPY